MFYISLGSGCFRHPNSEETMELIIASKLEYTDLFEFGKDCIRKVWEWDCQEGYSDGSLEERNNLSLNRTASASEIADMISHLQNIYWVDLVDFHEDQIINVIVLFEPKWNWETFAVETEDNYIYVEWATTA